MIHQEEEKLESRPQLAVAARFVGTVKQSLLYERLIFGNRHPFDFGSLRLSSSNSISSYFQPSIRHENLAI